MLISTTEEMKDTTIILYVGKYLRENEFVSSLDIQNYIVQDEQGAGGYRVELGRIDRMLTILALAEFIEEIGNVYTLKNKTIVHETIVKNVVPFADLRVSLED
jgi:hypothetical protein